MHPPANSMEQRVWRKGLAVGCELREVASRRADGSRHVIVSALVASCNSERHVLMVCLKPRDRKKWAMFPRIITDSKGNRNIRAQIAGPGAERTGRGSYMYNSYTSYFRTNPAPVFGSISYFFST